MPPPRQIYNDYPPGIRQCLLEDLAGKLGIVGKGDPYWKESERIFNALFRQNNKAMALEKAGKIEEAIEYYERGVSDRFGGNRPYDRLRIIYTRRKQYGEAIRVCKAFVDLADTLIEIGSPRPDLVPKRDKFLEWVAKLEKRKLKQKP